MYKKTMRKHATRELVMPGFQPMLQEEGEMIPIETASPEHVQLWAHAQGIKAQVAARETLTITDAADGLKMLSIVRLRQQRAALERCISHLMDAVGYSYAQEHPQMVLDHGSAIERLAELMVSRINPLLQDVLSIKDVPDMLADAAVSAVHSTGFDVRRIRRLSRTAGKLGMGELAALGGMINLTSRLRQNPVVPYDAEGMLRAHDPQESFPGTTPRAGKAKIIGTDIYDLGTIDLLGRGRYLARVTTPERGVPSGVLLQRDHQTGKTSEIANVTGELSVEEVLNKLSALADAHAQGSFIVIDVPGTLEEIDGGEVNLDKMIDDPEVEAAVGAHAPDAKLKVTMEHLQALRFEIVQNAILAELEGRLDAIGKCLTPKDIQDCALAHARKSLIEGAEQDKFMAQFDKLWRAALRGMEETAPNRATMNEARAAATEFGLVARARQAARPEDKVAPMPRKALSEALAAGKSDAKSEVKAGTKTSAKVKLSAK